MLIRYTHNYSLFINTIHSIIYLVVFWGTWSYINDYLLVKGAFQFLLVAVLIVGFIPVFIYSKEHISDPLGTCFYCRFSLGIPLLWTECIKYSPLFSYGGNWYPMKELRKVPKDERKYIFINTADKLLVRSV